MGESKVLVIGATGYIGKFIAKASATLGHPTYVLVRPSTLASKSELIESFTSSGITIVEGSLEDHASLVAAIKQVDVVISTVGGEQLLDQLKIIEAIREAGTVKRFLPSEFGNDVDRVSAVEPARTVFGLKAKVRRAVEEANIPYTYVSSNSFAGYFLPGLLQPGLTSPPRDKVIIQGDGNAKAIYVQEEDIGTFTIKIVDDPRTLNKIVYIRPAENVLSQNELVALWEKKIGKTLEKAYVPEEEILKTIKETPFPGNIYPAILHSILVKGDQYFEIGNRGLEATELYPDVKYTTVEEYLSKFV